MNTIRNLPNCKATTVHPGTAALSGDAARWVLGTRLQATSYEAWIQRCQELARQNHPVVVDFSNTHIVTLRRHDPQFREMTSRVDYFIPDGMPLIWCLNRQGARLQDRVYGPAFMNRCVSNCPREFTHYFLGGSETCLAKLQDVFGRQNPNLSLVGARNGYFKPEEEERIISDIVAAAPDFLWVGLGTPKQQDWAYRHKHRFPRGVIFLVGFAFDANAGTKKDAPMWMQRCGLTWMARMASEPSRLITRYAKYNSLFLWYLFWDGLRGRAFSPEP
jgi:N-acetylglucosaminyldiphosphoundecaprenol N-acetyl-beta-D-mannosaminyltransferase